MMHSKIENSDTAQPCSWPAFDPTNQAHQKAWQNLADVAKLPPLPEPRVAKQEPAKMFDAILALEDIASCLEEASTLLNLAAMNDDVPDRICRAMRGVVKLLDCLSDEASEHAERFVAVRADESSTDT